MAPERVRPDDVTLRAITEETVIPVIKLSVAEHQQSFVATNAVSLAQALFSEVAWYRAIYLGDEPVGFVMLYDETLLEHPPASPGVGLWRFMVDARFQGRGVGREALRQIIEHVRARGVAALELSYVPGPGCPEPFYRSFGFEDTGRMEDDEIVLSLRLNEAERLNGTQRLNGAERPRET
jgi:diamine N-acetyltransferase